MKTLAIALIYGTYFSKDARKDWNIPPDVLRMPRNISQKVNKWEILLHILVNVIEHRKIIIQFIAVLNGEKSNVVGPQ